MIAFLLGHSAPVPLGCMETNAILFITRFLGYWTPGIH